MTTSFDLSRYQDPVTIQRVLHSAKTVAIVGLSKNQLRASYFVGFYLRRHGYRVIPVNPNELEVLGEKAYASLEEVPEKIDIVDIFRRSEFVRPVVESAIRVGARAVWMQEGVEDAEAARLARAAGLAVVMDLCILKEHVRWKSKRDRLSPAAGG